MLPIWRSLYPSFGQTALPACLLSLERADGAVILSQPLTLDGSEHVDQIESSAFPDDQYLGRFWTFSGQGGDIVELKVERLEADFDPFVWIFQGIFQNTDEFVGGFSEYIDEDDPGFLAFADGGLPPYVLGRAYDTEDVLVAFALPQIGWAGARMRRSRHGRDRRT